MAKEQRNRWGDMKKEGKWGIKGCEGPLKGHKNHRKNKLRPTGPIVHLSSKALQEPRQSRSQTKRSRDKPMKISSNETIP